MKRLAAFQLFSLLPCFHSAYSGLIQLKIHDIYTNKYTRTVINGCFISPWSQTIRGSGARRVTRVTRIVLHVNNPPRPRWLSAVLFPLWINNLSFSVYNWLVIDVLQINEVFFFYEVDIFVTLRWCPVSHSQCQSSSSAVNQVMKWTFVFNVDVLCCC